ncbi:hypothetical protein G2W53_022114 [Senna tora]|uniref:CCHC-type domain-containing protein n=1 Tax=Senna tora TaxID=362788 RepID=A0A834WHU9_9FABA|nr:hypothetical protein G2W53_022114 [Senna tora]
MKGLIWYDVKKPLRCGVNLGNAKDGIYWADFRYEKIPKHCYTCGIFGHDEEECVDGKRADSDHGESDDNNLGSWLKARSAGKKITWPGLNKSGEQRRSVEEGRKVGMVRKVVPEDLMEKLARMTMREEVATPNENRCEDVRMEETQNMLVNPKMGVMQEKEEQIKIKGKSVDVATKVVSLTEQCKEGTKSEIKGSEKMTSCTNRRGEGVVLNEIQKVEVGEVVVAREAIKENINPLMIPSGGKQWKRLARNSGLIQEQNSLEQQVGKRKNMMDGTGEDEEKEPSSNKKMKNMEEMNVDSNNISAGNLMGATCGYRPSATWCSLMAGKEVLNKGVRRSIGNGRSTGVWTDPWIPSNEPTIAIRPSHIEIDDEKVSVLLNEDATEWIDGELRARFEEDICRRIKSIPPNPSQGNDRWTWEHDSKGVYSVKTGYRSLMMETWNQFNNGLDIDEGSTMRLWKRLWKLPITSRYKVFLWRACLGIIPTVDSLERRGMVIDEECRMCNSAPEDVFHALVDCPNLQLLWVMASFDYSSRVYHANILEWLVVEAAEWSEEKLAALAVALYHAWERRNKKKFANEVIRAEELWPRVERIMDELQTVMFNDDWNRAEPANFVWEKPEYPYTKLNVDATTCMDGGGSMGGLLRDETGDCVGVYVHSVSFPNDPALLEAISIRKGLEMVQQIGKTHVIVESDAKLVIDMLKTPCNQASTLNALLESSSMAMLVIGRKAFSWVTQDFVEGDLGILLLSVDFIAILGQACFLCAFHAIFPLTDDHY